MDADRSSTFERDGLGRTDAGEIVEAFDLEQDVFSVPGTIANVDTEEKTNHQWKYEDVIESSKRTFLFREVGCVSSLLLFVPFILVLIFPLPFDNQTRTLLPRLGQLPPGLSYSEEARSRSRSTPGEDGSFSRYEIRWWLPHVSSRKVSRHSPQWEASRARGCYSEMGQPFNVEVSLRRRVGLLVSSR